MPAGHPAIQWSGWQTNTNNRIFGAGNDRMRDGIYVAALVGIGSGNVAGFPHLGSAEWAECASLDDVVARPEAPRRR